MNRILLAAALTILSITIPGAQASEPSLTQLTRQTANYYRQYAGLSEDEQNDAAAAIAEELGDASPSRYNAVIVHLMAHYREEPTHRAAIETLARAIRTEVLPELVEDRNRNGVLTYAESVLATFAVYCTARSLWAVRQGRAITPSEMRGLVAEFAPELASVGSIIGGSRVIYDELRERRKDPVAVLSLVRAQLVQEAATQVRDIRAEIMALLAESDTQLSTHFNATRVRLARLSTQAERIDREMTELSQFAPELRGPINAVIRAWIEIEHLSDDIGERIDRLQFGDDNDDLRTPLRAP